MTDDFYQGRQQALEEVLKYVSDELITLHNTDFSDQQKEARYTQLRKIQAVLKKRLGE